MGDKYDQLSLQERCQIARLQAEGCALRKIAAALDRSPSTISREIARNRGNHVGYKVTYAQEQAKARRWSGSRLEREPELRRAVTDGLRAGWSPEQVAGRLAREQGRKIISYESIYRFIYARLLARRTIAGDITCRRGRASGASAAGVVAAPQSSSKAVFPWPNALPLPPIATAPVTGRPT